MRNSRLFEVTDGFGSLRIAVIDARNSNGHGRSPRLNLLCYRATTLPSKSRLTSTDFPSLIAVPRQTPLSSFFRPLTLLKPFDSMRDLAWPSVKLFAPATGAPGLFPFLLLTALLFGPSLAGGFCASAPLAARTRAIAETDIVRIVTSFVILPRRQCPMRRQVPRIPTPMVKAATMLDKAARSSRPLRRPKVNGRARG